MKNDDFIRKYAQAHRSKRKPINPQAPVAQKIAYEVVFRHFQGEGVEFF